METVTRLNIAVGLLTRVSTHRVTDPATGEPTWVTADPLLVQLVMAIKNSTAGTVFKSGAVHPPLPLSSDALDLLARIDEEATEHWWGVHRLHFGEGRGTLGGRIRAWAMAVQSDPALTTEAERIMSGWVRDIRALLEPQRKITIVGKCPECGTDRVLRQDGDGGTVMDHTLFVRFDADGNPQTAACLSCKTEWDWGQLASEMGVNDGNDDHMPAV